MDPNAALKEMREIASTNLDLWNDNEIVVKFVQLVELFEGLDQWLSKGGHLPDDWARKD